jgi:SAM-dependent methyltransferase
VPNLKARWNRFANSRAGTAAYFSLTSSHHSLTRVLLPVIERYARGRVLDLGAGYGTYRPALTQRGTSYVGLDIQPKLGTIDLLADGRSLPLASNQFDTVFCSQVLEHTPEPWRLIREAHRVLAPGGVFIASAPHLSYIHAAPEDYYRYTNYGLAFLLSQAGFGRVEVQPAGGLFSLLASVPPTLYLALLPERPAALVNAVLAVNRFMSRFFVALDDVVDRGKLFTLNFVAVAHKA